MQDKQTVGIIEMMFAMLLFLLGSAIILGIGLDAGKDAWFAILIAGAGGIILFKLYVYIGRKNDFGSLYEILKKQLGKHLGVFVSLVYAVYFAYIASRVLTDFTLFVSSSLLQSMQPFFIKIAIFLIIVYTYLKGLEPFIRSAVIFGFLTILFVTIIPIIILLSDIFHWDYFKPFFPIDMVKISTTTLPTLITFPFGELVVFLALFPYIKEKQMVSKWGSIVVIITTCLLSLFAFLTVGVLHPNLAKSYAYPIVTAIEHVDLFVYFQRLDILAVIVFIIGGYFKITIFIFAAMTVAKESLSKFKPPFLISIIFSLTLFFSYTYSENQVIHNKVGLEIVPIFLHFPLQIFVPVCLFILTILRKRFVHKS